MPTHAVEAPNGDIFVSDGYGQNRIHRFSAKGEHLLTFGGGDAVFIPKRFNLGSLTGRARTRASSTYRTSCWSPKTISSM
jgi:hypothetical protein